jgi:chorismate lyase/3-hydroxybenzoate synthase
MSLGNASGGWPDSACPYRLQYVDADRARPDDHTLACIRFGRDLEVQEDPRVIDVELQQIGARPQAQLWQSAVPVQQGRDEGIAYAHNGEVLFGSIRIAEADLLHMDRAAFRSYVRMDVLMRKLGYPSWLRVWIYMGGITRGEGDDERYRQFCLGRHRALALKPGFEQNLPAATAIGTHGDGLLIYFLAAREPGVQVENPRQLSAFFYPREYGPRSPSFSRAMLKPWRGLSHLYVSGTASIVGHASQHQNDPALQLGEVANNVRALVRNALEKHLPGHTEADCTPLGLKLYLRQRALLPLITPLLPQLFGADTTVLCMEGDICRRDLLLEVEGLYQLPASAA